MTPEQFRAACAALGWDTEHTAAVIGRDVRTVVNYRNGTSPVPVAVQRLILLLIDVSPPPAEAE